MRILLSSLEPHVLKSFRGVSVKPGGLCVLTPSRGQIAERDPDVGTVADRRELLERRIGCAEGLFRLVEAFALEKRAAEHELGLADLVEEVLTAVEQLQRLARMLLGRFPLAEPEMNGGEATHGLGCVALASRPRRRPRRTPSAARSPDAASRAGG